MELTTDQRRAIREFVKDEQTNVRIDVVSNSAQEPTIMGKGWYYETKTGKPIYHPSAYSRRGFSNMVYKRSTYRIEVGERWLLNSDQSRVTCAAAHVR